MCNKALILALIQSKLTFMKTSYLKSLCAVALALTLSACEKKVENFEKPSEEVAATTSELVYPAPSTDLSGNILPKRKLPRAILSRNSYEFPNVKVKVIDTVCAEYLQQTKKLGFSNLREGAFINKFGNNEFKITADHESNNMGFSRVTNGPKGWWTHWNYSPYTESEYPEVMFARNRWGGTVTGRNSMTLFLSSSVKIFGFEIAPNITGKEFKVHVRYPEHSSYRGRTMFSVAQTISSPSGARLIAVKSETPFDYLEIELEDMPFSGEGFAITNIRYALAY